MIGGHIGPGIEGPRSSEVISHQGTPKIFWSFHDLQWSHSKSF